MQSIHRARPGRPVSSGGLAPSALALLALLAAPATAWTGTAQPAAPQAGAPQVTSPFGLQRWRIEPSQSQVGFDGTSTLHDFTGKTRAVQGEVRFDPARADATSGGAIWIEAKTLDTDNSARDSKMRATLETERFPWIAFLLDDVDGALTDGRGDFVAKGRFQIHGVEKRRDVRFQAEPAGDGALRVQGEVRFRMTDHELDPPSVLFVTVDPEVRVWLDLRLVRAPGQDVPAELRRVRVSEEIQGAGGPEVVQREDRVWHARGARLWESGAEPSWLLDAPGMRAALDPRTGAPRPPLDVAAPGQALTREEPAPGSVVLRSGAAEWLRCDGLAGDVRVVDLLGLDPALHPGIGPAVAQLSGVPRELVVRHLDPQGRMHVRTCAFAAPEAATLPDWALAPEAWTSPPDALKAQPKAKKQRLEDE